MLVSASKTAKLSILVSLLLFSSSAFACQFHGGGMSFGGYGNWSHQGNGQNPGFSKVPKSWIEIKAPSMIKAEIGEQIEFTVNFEEVADVNDTKLKLELSQEITLIESKSKLDAGKGSYTYSIKASQEGIYRMVLVASAEKNTTRKSKRDVIYLQVNKKSV